VVDAEEFDRWRATAAEALSQARGRRDEGAHHWSCFMAEQTAQMAVKALLHGLGLDARGHDLVKLGRQLVSETGEPLPDGVSDALMSLSQHYIGTRYPDAHPSGTPSEHYSATQAEEAVAHATSVATYVDELWARARAAADDDQHGTDEGP